MKIAFKNCNVYSSFIPKVVHHSIVIENGKIISFNEESDAIDLNGKYIIPAFIDSHLHLDEIGLYLNSLDLRGVRSIDELREKLRDFASKTKGPIIGHGWDQELFREKRWPKKEDVDDIVGERPLFLSRVCLHAALVNSRFLEIMGKNGDGLVFENEFEIFRRKLISLIPNELKLKYMEDAMRYVLSKGICTVGYVSCSLENLKIVENLISSKKYPLDVNVYINAEDIENYDKGSRFVKGVKLFVDGSLGARTALLSEKYEDNDTYGEQVTSFEKLREIIDRANKLGLDVAIHAIGDRAIDIALDALRYAENGKRIEHASVVRDDQLKKFKGIHAVVQPHFIISDFWAVKRVGIKRARYVYRFKDLMKETNVAFSTDAPVEPVDPLLTIDAAINRGKNEGIELSKYTMDQALTYEEAYHCYTAGSAMALGIKGGTLLPGMDANFLILDRDPLKNDPKEIMILEIFCKGKKFFNY